MLKQNKLLLAFPLFSALLLGCQTTGQPPINKGTPLSGTEIKEIFSGNTVEGKHHEQGRQFRQYYHPNGTLAATSDDYGRRPDSDFGTWSVEGNRRCTQFKKWGEGKKWCREIYKNGDSLQTFSQKSGKLRETFSVKQGNPYNL
jgi:hypothetical protein